MLFNSYWFIFFFLPVSLIIYFLLNRFRLVIASKFWLVAASLFFYSWWDVKYLPLILGSILLNYSVGAMLGNPALPPSRRTSYLILGIASNLLVLGYFKYTNFFLENLNTVLAARMSYHRIVLPLGISFFTFTQIAYLVDVYNSKAKEYDLVNYSLFVTFFPHLLAGPIIHHKEMMPQFDSKRKKLLNYKNVSIGLFLFFIGLFKKVVIADSFAVWANAGFGAPDGLSIFEAWAATLSYTFQIYFDFSGYTDMALGASFMFNIILPINFNSPYKSLNIQDFWRRWHITLSRFLRDYVYIPMGGNRKGEGRLYGNLMVTFLLGGIWHGAGWTFVFWGFLHGAAIVAHRVWRKFNINMPKAVAWFLTFNFLNLTWIFFRARKWDDAIKIISGMFCLDNIKLPRGWLDYAGFLSGYGFKFGNWTKGMEAAGDPTLYIVVFLLVCLLARNSNEMLSRFKPSWRYIMFTVAVAICAMTSMSKVSEFLYFNF